MDNAQKILNKSTNNLAYSAEIIEKLLTAMKSNRIDPQGLIDGTQIAKVWCIEDVKSQAPHLSDELCKETLVWVRDHHDANDGIHWETIRNAAETVENRYLDTVTQCSCTVDGEPCKNPAVYTLGTPGGKIRVCENCDEDFTECMICGKVVENDEARFVNSEDGMKTCFECVPDTECSVCGEEFPQSQMEKNPDGETYTCARCYRESEKVNCCSCGSRIRKDMAHMNRLSGTRMGPAHMCDPCYIKMEEKMDSESKK